MDQKRKIQKQIVTILERFTFRLRNRVINDDTFYMAHFGTHPCECFYGNVRIDCHFQHTIFNVINTISKSIFANKTKKLGLNGV